MPKTIAGPDAADAAVNLVFASFSTKKNAPQNPMCSDLSSLLPAEPQRITLTCHLTLPVFSCTLRLGYQTLGEEYVNIVQVDSTQKRVPSLLRRAIFISLHTVVPYCLEKGLLHLERELQAEADESRTSQSSPALGLSRRTLIQNWIQKQVGELTEQQKKRVLQSVHVLKQCLPLLHRLHLAVFYISGTFYHLSKRIAGIRYVSGCISCLKMVFTAVFWPLWGCYVCKRDIEFCSWL